MRWLTALPVFNEARYVGDVLTEVARYSGRILVVDDGSTDATPEVLESFPAVAVVRHETNRGYGAALLSAFCYAIDHGYEGLVTVDCDGQHEPCRIPEFESALESEQADIVSGSRYLEVFPDDSTPPAQRREINRIITAELNERLGLAITDAFCGFKAYRASVLPQLCVPEPGYAMPLEVWAEAARHRLKIVELPVPLIYLDEERSFGGALDDAEQRLAHYRDVLERAIHREEPLPTCGKGRSS